MSRILYIFCIYKMKRSREKAIIYSLIMIKTDKLKTVRAVWISRCALNIRFPPSIRGRSLCFFSPFFFFLPEWKMIKKEKEREREFIYFSTINFLVFPEIEQILTRECLSRNENARLKYTIDLITVRWFGKRYSSGDKKIRNVEN